MTLLTHVFNSYAKQKQYQKDIYNMQYNKNLKSSVESVGAFYLPCKKKPEGEPHTGTLPPVLAVQFLL